MHRPRMVLDKYICIIVRVPSCVIIRDSLAGYLLDSLHIGRVLDQFTFPLKDYRVYRITNRQRLLTFYCL